MVTTYRKIEVSLYLQSRQQQETPVTLPDGTTVSWFTEFEQLYNKKLWHQLTLKLLAFVKQPDTFAKEDLFALYNGFIADFESKLNPLNLVEIVSYVSKQMISRAGDNAKAIDEVITFLESIKDKVKLNQDASILASILICRIKLDRGDLEGVKTILEEVSPLVDAETGVTPVHGRYFQLSSDFHQFMGNHNNYYRDALRYLGCIDLSQQDPEDLKKRAFALSLAGLLGDGVFNFGELLQHQIIQYVKQDWPWLLDLLTAFNSGDIQKYEALRPKWSSQPDLAASEIHLRQKISLLCLMELTFKSSSGVLTFQEIATQTRLPLDEVELLVMKALSLKLIKGSIDEVDQKVNLTWVQPRVLDKEQIAGLRTKIDNWTSKVCDISQLLESNAQEILT